MACAHLPALQIHSSSRLEAMEPFVRTLIAGAILHIINAGLERSIWREYEPHDLQGFGKLSMALMNGETRPKLPSNASLVSSLRRAMYGRSFFLTEDHRPGLCYPNTQSGDEIWICSGSRMPFILRPCDDRAPKNSSARFFFFMGACYVDGLMDGAAFENIKEPLQEIVLV
jgi:hypothetical protein